MSSSIIVPAELDQLCINTIRTLSMDAVERAKSGHPGTPMALAPLAYSLWTRHMKHDPGAPDWADRDRFILSAGHASMLLYSMLYLTGYGLEREEIINFRQWESRTPGHPEHGMTPGVETTTGPLGQGISNAVGMAIAEARLAALFNTPENPIVDHYTWVICSDGDLMEGVSSEAASLAGHLGLGKLICFWDDNSITIEGSTDLAFTEDVLARYEAYGWQTLRVDDVNDLDAIDAVVRAAKADPRPTMVGVKTVIGFGSPNKAGSEDAHGAPLGEAEIRLTKQALGWPEDEAFLVPEAALAHMRMQQQRGEAARAEWNARLDQLASLNPERAAGFLTTLECQLSEGWDAGIPTFDKPIATRAASGKVLNAIASRVPWLVGGSADLAGSNNTNIDGEGSLSHADPAGRNIHYGVREHGMGSVMNGMALHGGVRPYGATFLIFSDYMRPPIRLASLMEQPVIYVFTHDSIGLGEDGPTHQPVEQMAALRAIPGLVDLRPADAAETAEAWRWIMENPNGPAFLALTRQALPILDRTKYGSVKGIRRGGYILAEAEGGAPSVILIASGSEVELALAAREKLQSEGVPTRVVNLISWALFERQGAEYINEVLPPSVRARVAVEAGSPMGWHRWVGSEGRIVGIARFGASAPASRLFREFGFTVENVVAQAYAALETGRA